MRQWIVLLGAFGWCALSFAGEAPKKHFDIELPATGDIPKANGLTGSPPGRTAPELKGSTNRAGYVVTRVQHARSFVRKSAGTMAVGPMISIPLGGDPPSTEKFSTLVRVKSPDGLGAPIEVSIVNLRGDAAMTSSGQVTFPPGAKETDYLIDWDPTPVRSSGSYAVLVRIAGETLGRWPIVIADRK